MTAQVIPFPVTSPEQAEAARVIAGLLAPHMSSYWLASVTKGHAHGVVAEMRKVEAARRALVLAPANAPEKDAAWADLYEAVVGPPPPNSVPLRKVIA